MRRVVVFVVLQVIAAGALVAVSGSALGAVAAHGHGGAASALTGNDVSYPQCGTTFPASPAFAIAGVNGGLANDPNPCLGPSPSYQQSELYWAANAATGGTSQPRSALYVNTADPGDIYNNKPIADWPTSSLASDPYGNCITTIVTTRSGTFTVGENSTACAWQYGYAKASQDVSWVAAAAAAINAQAPPHAVPGAASSYQWWLDVETVNTWQSGTSGQQMNVADLQGMIAALNQANATNIGAYSTTAQWGKITGGTTSPAAGSLYKIPDWIPGAKTLSGAKSNCSLASFTGGRVAVTQWSGHPDNDYAC